MAVAGECGGSNVLGKPLLGVVAGSWGVLLRPAPVPALGHSVIAHSGRRYLRDLVYLLQSAVIRRLVQYVVNVRLVAGCHSIFQQLLEVDLLQMRSLNGSIWCLLKMTCISWQARG